MKFNTERDLNAREASREALNAYTDADLFEIPNAPWYLLDAQTDVLNHFGVEAWQHCEFVEVDEESIIDYPVTVRCTKNG